MLGGATIATIAPAANRDVLPTLGLRANWRQFALLIAINAFVGGMVGMERTVLPLLAGEEFGIASKAAAVSFVVTFGLTKAFANLFAGSLSEKCSRRRILIAGWFFAIPVPFVLIFAPSWEWIIAANALLGVNQGLAWSMTVNMKVDLVGPSRRGLALGLNEAAGYLSVAAAAFATGVIADGYGLRPEPFYLGILFAACGLGLSVLFVKDTRPYVAVEAEQHQMEETVTLPAAFARTSWQSSRLFGISQAGFVNNLNDALAWGVFPLFFVSRGLSLQEIGILAAVYPLVWGALQMGTGWLSDSIGRSPLIVSGMLLQAVAISLVGIGDSFGPWLIAMGLLGVGTAMVYPVLLAAIGDYVYPASRATYLGVYRFWRDAGAMIGALVAGLIADALGFQSSIQVVAALTAASGILAAATLSKQKVKVTA
ncbi:MAG TPA: MFS transporter [Dehalococcoidia bacterium]|nr:MFS transporter [Dehalococcoidia bacterium]